MTNKSKNGYSLVQLVCFAHKQEVTEIDKLPPPPPSFVPNPDLLSQFVGMGFSIIATTRALDDHQNDGEEAMNQLICDAQMMDAIEIEEELKQEQVIKNYRIEEEERVVVLQNNEDKRVRTSKHQERQKKKDPLRTPKRMMKVTFN
jgi:uncharacterized UBP type Zn finger protein